VHFYQPSTEEPSPLLVVWDGQDYLRRARITRIVDNLIHEGRIRPIALAMVEHGRQARMVEYGCSEIVAGFAVGKLLEAARQRLKLVDIEREPGAYGILGASMGGLMALYVGLRAPRVFGKVLSQSGAFSLGEHDMPVWDLLRLADPQSLKIWMDVGHYEWLLETNRRMAGRLTEGGFSFAFQEYYGGHNYTSWRNELADGLLYAFGKAGAANEK
jgi:enterochelin esterase family protein